MKLDRQLTQNTRINSKWIRTNESHEIIKIVEDNIGSKMSDISHSNIFANMSPRARKVKGKINK